MCLLGGSPGLPLSIYPFHILPRHIKPPTRLSASFLCCDRREFYRGRSHSEPSYALDFILTSAPIYWRRLWGGKGINCGKYWEFDGNWTEIASNWEGNVEALKRKVEISRRNVKGKLRNCVKSAKNQAKTANMPILILPPQAPQLKKCISVQKCR